MKAITPVISLVMLLLITVGIVGLSWVWFSGLFSSQTKKFISIPAGGGYCSGGDIKIYLLNNGNSPLTSSDIIVAQVDGVDVKGTPFFGDMKSGLVGWWKFDEGSGSVASDSSGSGNTGNLINMEPADWVSGKSKTALIFDGVNEYVDAAKISTSGDVSIMAWIYPTVYGASPSGDNQRIIHDYDGSSDLQIILDEASMFKWGSAKLGVGVGVSSRPSLNTWTHITATRSGLTYTIYYNGIQQTTSSVAPGDPSPTTQAFRIAADITGTGNNGNLNGRVDEVKVYSKSTGDFNIQPGSSGLVINYPGTEGRHSIRVATSSGATETTVTCS